MKKIFFILFILCFRIKQFGQVTSGGLPYTFEINTINPTLLNYRGILSSINQTVLPNLDNIALKQQAENESASCVDCKNFYYGKFLNQNINIISQGTYELIDNVKVYRYKVISPTAEALQFYFTQFNVPEGGRLYIYNEDKTILFGALTSDNINYTSQDVIKLATVPIHGGSLVLEYNEPLDSPFSASIEIGYIVHVFDKKFSSAPSDKSASCNNDVVCPTGYGWDNEKKAVVMILSRTPNTDWGGFCTGTLLNNTTNNKTPYLITAGHCFRSETNVVDPVFHPGSSLYVFNYENINCNDNIETTFNLTNSIYGAYDLSTKYINSNNTVSYDYSLLKLKAENDQNPSSYYDKYLSRFGVCFAGWNRSTTLNSNQKPYVIIHHPNGDNKKITVTKLNEDAKSVNKIGEIPSPSGAHFEVKYSTGVTERGSSGAALFDSYHKLIGTLWGGKSDCGIDGLAYNEEPDLYFKFSRAWTDGNFQAWLDPINSGVTSVNALCPPPEDPDPPSGNNCRTVRFTINDKVTYSNKFMNICTDNVILKPYKSSCTAKWLFKASEQTRNCNKIDHKWYATRCDETYQGLRCHCYFLQLMVSIMEVDQSKNSIGPEYLEWVYIYDSNTSVQDEYDNFIALDLNQYAPQGFHMQPGKKYKIRVASLIPDTYPSQFTYYDAFVSTFAPLNVINNQVLDYTMIGDNVIIQNSTSQINNTNLKVVASNSIRISVTSNLKSGRYYIDQVNCNNITNFRSSVSGQKRSQQGSLNENYLISESSIISGDNSQMRLSQNEFKIFPNPGNGYYTVSASNIHNSTVEIYNMFGVLIKSELVDNSESIIDISSCPNGMYIFRFKNQNGEQKSIKVIKE